jgi:hypothetical protein
VAYFTVVRVYLPDLPLCAVRQSGPGRWLILAPSDDPFTPAVSCVAVLEEAAYAGTNSQPSSDVVIRAFRSFPARTPKTRAEVGGIAWPRQDLLEIAHLLDRLDVRDVERFSLQRQCLARQLRRIAARRVAHAS